MFGDAIAAMERAAENDDHLKKIQSVIIEIDARQRQLAELLEKREELEKKISTDANRDTLNKEYQAELDQLNTHLRETTGASLGLQHEPATAVQ